MKFITIFLLLANSSFAQPLTERGKKTGTEYIDLYIKETLFRRFEQDEVIFETGDKPVSFEASICFPVIFLFIETAAQQVVVMEPVIIRKGKQYFWLYPGEYRVQKIKDRNLIAADIEVNLF